MKAATFNANSIRSRMPIIVDWLQSNQPDILCIQETKVQDPDFPIDPFEKTGYEFVFRGEKKYNGVAIFSKQPIENVSYGLDSKPRDPARLISATIKDIQIVNTYIPQGQSRDSEKFDYKLNWFKHLRQYFSTHFHSDENILWMGDFNVAMDERDVHDPSKLWGSVCYCQEVIDGLKNVMDWGFTDTFRHFNQKAEQYTFWDYRVPNGFKRNVGWRLDYIMATKSMIKKAVDCYVDTAPRAMEKPSDHTFLVAEFKD